MSYSQLYVNLKVNNQVTIGLQNTRLISNVGKSAYLTHNQVAENQIEKHFPVRNAVLKYKKIAASDRQNSAKSRKSKGYLNWFFGIKKNPLDIMKKLQAICRSCTASRFGILKLYTIAVALVIFGQYQKNKIKRFGNIQAQAIHECGAALEMLSGQSRFCHVTTLTLPANTHEAFECLAARSGSIINSLFQPIRDRYPDMKYWFFVWEYQKRGALHLHIAHYHPDECEGMLIGNLIIEKWHQILCDISESTGIWMLSAKHNGDREMKEFYQYHTQPMRKSVAGYFSKYASKASNKEENNYVKKFSEMYPPSRFWGCSSQIKLIRKENSFSNCRDYTENKEFMYCLFVRIHKMISECNIVLQNTYKFKVDLSQNLCVAEGFRNTFYLSPNDYQRILNDIRKDFDSF